MKGNCDTLHSNMVTANNMKTAATGMMKVGGGVKGGKLSLQIFKIRDWLTMHNVQKCKVAYEIIDGDRQLQTKRAELICRIRKKERKK